MSLEWAGCFVIGIVLASSVLLAISIGYIKRQHNELSEKTAHNKELTKAIQELIRGVHHEGPNENLKRIRALIALFLMDENIDYLKKVVDEAKKAEDKILNHARKYNHLQK
jgi:hypothetical protein